MEHARKILKNISPNAWEHPADRAAMAALKQLPVLEDVIKTLFGGTSERSLRYLFLASAVRSSPTQFERVHRLTTEACNILDAPQVPEVFIAQNPTYNAMAVGFRTPFIVLHSALEDSLSDDELLGVVAHEVGHIMSGHALYKTILYLLVNIGLQLLHLPVGRAGLISLIMALREWDRKSELSADRAALLVTQSTDTAYTTLMKLAGGSKTDQMNIEEFVAQAAEYDRGDTVLDGVYKLVNLLGQTHPFPVLRLSELKTWVEAGSYDKILEGSYPQRDQDEREDLFTRFQEAADAYRDEIHRSEDPLAQVVDNLNQHFEKARTQAEDLFKNLFGR
ncbi:M48 family metallopeptidase [Spirochaeta africana]|uniref:Zn-dependent protease with chaperone function n=1 Tax=Spirochaeta africana (strain ATCC 700263 / DSM 8902 / Z-7692) TaxID=889378 RepID=H9UFS0_SPIAZ|nr:M48 family metallopeptidase [Spirochaeta africana]AFG36363.1 Zn-dependent protease with chaperone function [Spirochaeta africana DSM 8902]